MTRETLEGLAQLTRQLNALSSLEEGKALRLAVRAGIKPAFQRAQETMPVGSEPHRLKNGLLVNAGYAKSTLRIITTINSAKNIASAVMSTRKLAYYEVKWVELGSHKMAAQPWIRRALAETRSQGEEAFKASIGKAIERAAKTK